jgi:hypothetical protein
MVADERLGVSLRQPAGILAAPEPLQNHRARLPLPPNAIQTKMAAERRDGPSLAVALDGGMNLALVQIEHAHGNGAPPHQRWMAVTPFARLFLASARCLIEDAIDLARERRKAVIRHWVITDADGRNPRHVTLAEYVEALERGERILIDSIIDRPIVRPAPATLAEAAQALANC